MIDSTNGDGSPIDDDAQSIQRAYDDLDKAFAKPVLANDADGFDEALIRLEMKLRYNELSERAELFRYDERSHDDRWMTWNTQERSWVIHEIRKRFHTRTRKGDIVQLYFRRDDADLAINTLLRDRHVNPFLDEWINVLPEWDGTPRLGSWLSDLFEVEDPDDALLVWASRFVFLGAVRWRKWTLEKVRRSRTSTRVRRSARGCSWWCWPSAATNTPRSFVIRRWPRGWAVTDGLLSSSMACRPNS